jgi:hypothetical protein
MNLIKKAFLTLLFAATFILPVYATSGTASAVNIFGICDAAQNTDVCKDVKAQGGSHDNPIVKIIGVALEVVSWAAGVAAIVLIILSGMKFMTAGGDPNDVKGARSHLIHAIIGLIIIVIAQTILRVVIGTTK